ncbi:MAG: hypothetical protein ABIL58_23670 [Pseudomonadota bacterium]
MSSENVNEARTILLDKDGNVLPVPAGTDPHLEKKQKTGTRDTKITTRAPVSAPAKGGKS